MKRDVTFQAVTEQREIPQGWFLQHIWVEGKGWQWLVTFKREQYWNTLQKANFSGADSQEEEMKNMLGTCFAIG